MYSLETLARMNNEEASKAAQMNMRPYVIEQLEEVDEMPPFPFPSIGDHEPEGWEPLEDTWFVDSSGFGASNEPALTAPAFRKALKEYVAEWAEDETIGFAVVSVGQFQVHVRAFRKKS